MFSRSFVIFKNAISEYISSGVTVRKLILIANFLDLSGVPFTLNLQALYTTPYPPLPNSL